MEKEKEEKSMFTTENLNKLLMISISILLVLIFVLMFIAHNAETQCLERVEEAMCKDTLYNDSINYGGIFDDIQTQDLRKDTEESS